MKLSTQILIPIVGVTVFAQIVFGSVAYLIILEDHSENHVHNLHHMASTIQKNWSESEAILNRQNYLRKVYKGFTTDESILLLNTNNKLYITGVAENYTSSIYDDVVQAYQDNPIEPRGGTINIDDVSYHWNSTQIGDDNELIFIESCVKYKSDSNLAVRLLVTSIIIMWVAVWVGLILSHIISKSLNQKSDELKHQAFHDKLTGLPNRLLLLDRLQQALLESERHGKPFALLLMDLDNFKDLNDTLGHHYGDELLQQVGEKIKQSLRKHDTLARLGGDEFAAVLHDTDLDGVLICVDKLLANMKTPHTINGTQIESKASIGIAVFPFHGEDGDTLLQHADVAMYQAKKTGTGYAIYDSSYDLHSVRRLQLMNEMRSSIEKGQISVHYQPMILQGENRVVAVEALARWHHPEMGFVPPDEFIPVAEQTGLIRKLTLNVLNTALRDCKKWRDDGYDIHISVNISPHCLQDSSFPANLQSIVDNTGLTSKVVELEITETALMLDLNSARQVLQYFHDAGYKLSIDDFGTGFSSLEHLKELPIDTLKIDKTFVMDMNENDNDAAIVRSVTELGHNLNCKVVAEGVENKETLQKLVELNVDVVQGYLFSKPISSDEIEDWLTATQWQANILS